MVEKPEHVDDGHPENCLRNLTSRLRQAVAFQALNFSYDAVGSVSGLSSPVAMTACAPAGRSARPTPTTSSIGS